jgi:hypothetical protein
VMTETELRDAITGPASEVAVPIEPQLPNVIIDDLRTPTSSLEFDVGVLPLLSQTMFATWEHRDEGGLTVRAYRRGGGVADAVQSGAEAVYRRLSAADQDIAQLVLTHLTQVTDGGVLARRRSTMASLYAAMPVAARDINRILEAFASKRLITLHADTAEIAHDVLLRSWPRLRDWLDSDRADQVLCGTLIADATTWSRHDRDQSYLYRGAQLATVEYATTRWAADPVRHPAITPDARAFLIASKRAQAFKPHPPRGDHRGGHARRRRGVRRGDGSSHHRKHRPPVHPRPVPGPGRTQPAGEHVQPDHRTTHRRSVMAGLPHRRGT